MKKIIIWICSMIAIFFIVNFAGGAFVNGLFANTYTPATLGWSKKSDTFIHPKMVEVVEEDKNNGLSGLYLRAMICNGKFNTKTSFLSDLTFSNITVEESHIFFDKNGTNELSYGTFISVYNDTGEPMAYARRVLGIIIVDDFCNLDGAKKFYKEIKNKELIFRLDSYTMGENYVITPVDITVFDKNNNELFKQNFPANGNVIKAENIYFSNENNDAREYGTSLSKKMDNVYDGMKKTGKIVNKLKGNAVFDSGDQSDTDSSFGIFKVTTTNVEVRENKAMVSAICYDYHTSVILYTIILGIILAIIMFAVSEVKKKKNQFY